MSSTIDVGTLFLLFFVFIECHGCAYSINARCEHSFASAILLMSMGVGQVLIGKLCNSSNFSLRLTWPQVTNVEFKFFHN